jgi:hypothetical protein
MSLSGTSESTITSTIGWLAVESEEEDEIDEGTGGGGAVSTGLSAGGGGGGVVARGVRQAAALATQRGIGSEDCRKTGRKLLMFGRDCRRFETLPEGGEFAPANVTRGAYEDTAGAAGLMSESESFRLRVAAGDGIVGISGSSTIASCAEETTYVMYPNSVSRARMICVAVRDIERGERERERSRVMPLFR